MKSPPPVIKLKKRVRKSTPKRRFTKKTVLKMLAASEASASTSSSVPKSESSLTIQPSSVDGVSPGTSPADLVQDFLNTGRTGRRNAMADILGRHAGTTTADLPSCLQALTTHDTVTPSSPSTSQVTSPSEQPSTSTGTSSSSSS